MGQRRNYAARKDAQIELRKEECAIGMGHGTQTMKPLHLVQSSNRLLLLDPNSMGVLLDFQWGKVHEASQER